MATATLTWIDPTTRVDGSALAPADIARVDVYDSASPTPRTPIGSVLGTVQTFTTGVLDVATHSFTVIVVDTTGHSSAPSNAATVTVAPTLANPAAVTNLSAVLNP